VNHSYPTSPGCTGISDSGRDAAPCRRTTPHGTTACQGNSRGLLALIRSYAGHWWGGSLATDLFGGQIHFLFSRNLCDCRRDATLVLFCGASRMGRNRGEQAPADRGRQRSRAPTCVRRAQGCRGKVFHASRKFRRHLFCTDKGPGDLLALFDMRVMNDLRIVSRQGLSTCQNEIKDALRTLGIDLRKRESLIHPVGSLPERRVAVLTGNNRFKICPSMAFVWRDLEVTSKSIYRSRL
jgi:hypothetical protein